MRAYEKPSVEEKIRVSEEKKRAHEEAWAGMTLKEKRQAHDEWCRLWSVPKAVADAQWANYLKTGKM